MCIYYIIYVGKICNPVTGRMVSIYGKVGRKIINNYIKKISDIASLTKGKNKNIKNA